MGLVGDQGFDLVDVPDVMLVRKAIERFTGFRIALIRQYAVAMNGVVAAPPQLVADRRLAGAGNPFDQIVPDAHFRSLRR